MQDTKPNGRIRVHPGLAWTIVMYLLSLGLGTGILIAQVAGARSDIAEVRADFKVSAPIVARLEAKIEALEHQIDANQERIVELERGRRSP